MRQLPNPQQLLADLGAEVLARRAACRRARSAGHGATVTAMVRVPWRHLIGGVIGGTAGFAYYYFLGCDSG